MAEEDTTSQDLSAYLDGELSEADAGRVGAALESSGALRQDLAELRALRQLMLAQPVYRAGSELTARIVAAAEQLQARGELSGVSSSVLRWARRLAVAAVIMIATGAGVMVSMNWLSPEQTPVGTEVARSDPQPDAPSGLRKKGLGTDSLAKDAKVMEHLGYRGRASVAEEASNEVIITHDDLTVARRNVERVLLSNGVRPDVVRGTAKAGKGRLLRAGGNTYRFSQQDAETASYEVVGSPEQVTNICIALGRTPGVQVAGQSQFLALKAKSPSAPVRPSAKPSDSQGPGHVSKREGSFGAGSASKPAKHAATKETGPGGRGGRGGQKAAVPPPGGQSGQDGPDGQILVGQDKRDSDTNFLKKLAEMIGVLRRDHAQGDQGGEQAPQVTGGVEGERKQQKEIQDDGEAVKQKADRANLVQANVQRLVITLNKRTLSVQAETRRATDRSSPAAKE